jgi:hypothetical protein
MKSSTRVKRGKSNISTPFTKKIDPENLETGEIKCSVETDYTPSDERLAREAQEKQENERASKSNHTKRGALKNSSSDFWGTLGDDVEYIDKTDWNPLESNIKPDDNTDPLEDKLHKSKSTEEQSFWDGLSGDTEYMGDTDWSEFRKKPTVVVESDIDDSKTDEKRKTRARRTGKSKSASTFSIRKCKKCMLDCEYSAYLCGAPMNRSFTFNKSTCPKR